VVFDRVVTKMKMIESVLCVRDYISFISDGCRDPNCWFYDNVFRVVMHGISNEIVDDILRHSMSMMRLLDD